MPFAQKAPGVYREDVFPATESVLRTGIPGFVGFARAADSSVLPPRPVAIKRRDEFAAVLQSPDNFDGYLEDAVRGFFANGGERCYVVPVDIGGLTREHMEALKNGKPAETVREALPLVESKLAELATAIEALGSVDDLDLVAVPDSMALTGAAAAKLQSAALRHCCREGNRFAILDSPPGLAPYEIRPDQWKALSELLLSDLARWRDTITRDLSQPENGALYYPWVRNVRGRLVPPCGHVAGIFARSDAKAGVFKAPANEELQEILDLESPVDAPLQELLNPAGINCLRAIPGRGMRVWGARTLSLDPHWRYVNVRRLFHTLFRWIERNMAWATFEPNEPRLWIRIQRELSVHLGHLWQAGALKGETAVDAFYVKCDAETNAAEEREQGGVTTEIGLAAAAPAEFIVVRIIHRAAGAEQS